MLTRRTFILAGIAGGAALAAAHWLRGDRHALPSSLETASLAILDVDAPAIVAAIVPIMLDGALPTDSRQRTDRISETVANVARAVAGLPPAAQGELGQLFALLGFAPSRIALAGVASPWREADRRDVAKFLEDWRTSNFTLLRSAYDALHQLVFAAWYGNPTSWPAIGYDGPPALFG